MASTEEIIRESTGISKDAKVSDSWYDEQSGDFHITLSECVDWLSGLLSLPGAMPKDLQVQICGNIKTKDSTLSISFPKFEPGLGVILQDLRGDLSLSGGELGSVSLEGVLVLEDYVFRIDLYRYAKGCWALIGEMASGQEIEPGKILTSFAKDVVIPDVLSEMTISTCSITFIKEQEHWVPGISLVGILPLVSPSDSFVVSAVKEANDWTFRAGVNLYGHDTAKQDGHGLMLQGAVTGGSMELRGESPSPLGTPVPDLIELLTGDKPNPAINELPLPNLVSLDLRVSKDSGKCLSGSFKGREYSATIALVLL
ncbi:hypothetical protein [Streptomyces sp. NPDC001635]|nr:hypothetical protein E4K10_47275 [Streptomyces sp. T1317-0309]